MAEEAEAMEIDTQGAETTEIAVVQSEDEIRPIAILIDELSQEDIQTRISALKQVATIAGVLGAARTRNELIPFLTDMLDDDDEALKIICEVLYSLREFVEGEEHYHTLIAPYEILCVVEEVSIRNEALKKLSLIIKDIPQQQVLQHLPPLFNRLRDSDWHTARTAAAGLAPAIFPRLILEERDYFLDFQNKFFQLAEDDMPQVRRALAENIGNYALKIPTEESANYDENYTAEKACFPIIRRLAEDAQDSVRVRALQALIQMFHLIKDSTKCDELKLTIRHLCHDQSWRVRFLAASEYYQICNRLGGESMLEQYLQLLKDQEAEVRAAAASQLHRLASGGYIDEETMERKFVPCFKDLLDDSNKYARAQFAEVVVKIGKVYSEEFVQNHLLTMILKLLKDPDPEPRLRCLSSFDSELHGIEQLSESICPCIVDLAKDKSWRIRESVIDMLPQLIGRNIVETQLKEELFGLMTDQVFEVRSAAAKAMFLICQEENDQKWSIQILDQIAANVNLGQSTNYLYRQSAIEAITHLAVLVPTESWLNALFNFSEDRVPNVRFKFCKAIKEIHESGCISGNIVDDVKSRLTPLIEKETDQDVRYFCSKTLEVLNSNSMDTD